MRNKKIFLTLALLFGVSASGFSAQNPPASGSKPYSKSPEARSGDPSSEDAAEPFDPFWSGNVAYNFSIQPSQLSSGQINQDVVITGNYNLSESGDYFSLGMGGGEQTLEGSGTSYGTFTAGAGLGLGIFQPSLDLAFQQGAQALASYAGTLTLTFQFFKPLSVGLLGICNPQSHQGALSTILGGKSEQIDEVDSLGLAAGAALTFSPWDFLNFSLTGEQDYSLTYQWQNILHTAQTELNHSERIPSITLEGDLTVFTDFTLSLSIQEGQEFFPAGINYSPILKKTVNFASPTSDYFSGYTFGLSYAL